MTIGDYYIAEPAIPVSKYISPGSPDDSIIAVDANASGDGLMRYHRPLGTSDDIRVMILVAFNANGGAIEEYAVVNADPLFTLVAWEHNCDHSDCEPDCDLECYCEQQALETLEPCSQ